MATISAILFDKDGTLFDFHRTWGAWSRRFLLDLAADDTRLARRMAEAVDFDIDTARYGRDSILVAATPHDIAEALLPFLPGAGLAGVLNRMNALSADVVQQEATPLGPLLDELASRGLRLGVVTNDSEAPARAHLRAAGVLDRFDRVLGCDSGYAPKPAPDMLLAFAELGRIEPAQVVLVGDSPHDMVAAQAAGMRPVGVLTGVALEGQLKPLADAVLPSIAALPRWLDRMRLETSAA
jgi:phosphoglycolate phosphatase